MLNTALFPLNASFTPPDMKFMKFTSLFFRLYSYQQFLKDKLRLTSGSVKNTL